MNRDFTLRLPVPAAPLLLTSNQRLHWAEKAKRTKYWRGLTATLCRTYHQPTYTERVHITVTITWPDKTRRDPNNWEPTGKAIVDGLRDAGILTDDDHTRVVGPDMRADPTTGPRSILVRVHPLDEEDGPGPASAPPAPSTGALP